MKMELCPKCSAIECPESIGRWELLADFATDAGKAEWKHDHPKYQRRLFATYLQQAFESGFKKGKEISDGKEGSLVQTARKGTPRCKKDSEANDLRNREQD